MPTPSSKSPTSAPTSTPKKASSRRSTISRSASSRAARSASSAKAAPARASRRSRSCGCLASTAKIETGRIAFLGKDLVRLPERQMQSIRGRDISMIFQEPMTSLNPVFTVGAQIMEAIMLHQKVTQGRGPRRRRSSCFAKSAFPKPEQRVDSYPHQMSGGQKQRVMIAMALSCNPQLLIADEPTTALDVTIQAQILEILRKLRDERGMAIIFITHDLGVIAEIADDVLVMFRGEEVEYGPVLEIFERPASTRTRRACSPAGRGWKRSTAGCRRSTTSWKPCARTASVRDHRKEDGRGAARAARRRRAAAGCCIRRRELACDRPSVGRRPPRARHADRRRRAPRRCSRVENLQGPFPGPPRHSCRARSTTSGRSTASASTSIAAKRSASSANRAAAKRRPAGRSCGSSSPPAAASLYDGVDLGHARRRRAARACAARCKSSFRIPTARSTRG